MKQLIAVLSALATAMPILSLEGAELQPPDLTPVTWRDTPVHPPVEIVREGRARAVVHGAGPDPDAKLERLADELVEVIRLSTGATLERVTTAPADDRPAIVIGDSEASRQVGIDAPGIPIEGFEVKTAANQVYPVGSTKALPPGSDRWADGRNQGTAWAVADFFERLVGVRRVSRGGRGAVKVWLLDSPT